MRRLINIKGIRFKIISSLCGLLIVVFGVMILTNIKTEHTTILSEMERNGKLICDMTLLSIRAPMARGENELITNNFIVIKKRMPNIELFVSGTEQKVTWSTNSEAQGKDVGMFVKNKFLLEAMGTGLKSGTLAQQGFEEKQEGSSYYSVIQPIMNEKSCLECHDENKKVLGFFVSRQSVDDTYLLLGKLTGRNIFFGAAGFVLLVVLLYILISYLVANPIKKVDRLLKDIAQGEGDLTARLDSNRQDELGGMSHWFNTFVERLQQLIRRVVETTRDFSMTTESISAESNELASRTSQQAAAVTETSSTIEEFSRSIVETTANADEVKTEIEAFNREINEKKELIQNVTSTMSVINDSSQKINQIINVINDISFQTNLLALNAAVEAARAGEAGRGFAVVASEVRSLAQKTAEASKTIRDIVGQNVDSTHAGMELVQKTSEFFTSMFKVMEGILDKVREISVSSQQQTSAIEQITQTISELDEAIRRNAELSGELNDSVNQIKLSSTTLADIASHFKV
jgi:methyl-accepting chemotaxis protein